MSRRTSLFAFVAVSVVALAGACFAPAVQAQSALASAPASTSTSLSPLGKLHTVAVTSFQQGRFPEAYGRFMALANSGHAPAAEVALFMALNGTAVFGKDWDVTQDELTVWAALAGQPAPELKARVYPRIYPRSYPRIDARIDTRIDTRTPLANRQ